MMGWDLMLRPYRGYYMFLILVNIGEIVVIKVVLWYNTDKYI